MEEDLQTLEELNRKNLELLASISPWTIVGGLVFGIAGVWFFRRGRNRGNKNLWWIGIALMVYPLFTLDPWFIWIIGSALCGLGYYWRRETAG